MAHIKSQFLTPLRVLAVGDDTFVLTTDFYYASAHLDRVIKVPEGFQTDFASVPRLPLAYLLFGGVARRAAVVHDFLYRNSGISRSDADAIFREAMEASGIDWFRRSSMWAGVRLFGWTAYANEKGPPDEVEPDDLFGSGDGA
jgi:hypothetical protein